MEATSTARAKACLPCAKAKARCEFRARGKCRRCHRLNKECIAQPRQPAAPQDSNKSGQIAVLEEKLDRVLSILSSSSEQQRTPGSNGGISQKWTDSVSSGLHEHPAVALDDGDPVETYRQSFAPLFPFIVIPLDMTSAKLYKQSPFLHLSISMITCKRAQAQKYYAHVARQSMAERIVMNNECSLDLLQGLLVHIAWWHIHFRRLPQIKILLHLALGQLTGLRLNQSQLSRQETTIYKGAETDDDRQPRTLEERAAYLGCYYLAALSAACFHAAEAPSWTAYTDECCQMVEQDPTYSDAGSLMRLVRLLELTGKINHRPISEDASLNILATPVGLNIRWFRSQLDNIQASTAFGAGRSIGFTLLHRTIDIAMYKFALIEDPSSATSPERPYSADQGLAMLDLLSSGLASTRAFFDTFLSLPTSILPYVPYTFWILFRYALMILSRLLAYHGRHDQWDLDYARKTADYAGICDQMTVKLDEARELYYSDGILADDQIESFRMMSQRIQMIKMGQKQAEREADVHAMNARSAQTSLSDLTMSFDEMFDFTGLDNWQFW